MVARLRKDWLYDKLRIHTKGELVVRRRVLGRIPDVAGKLQFRMTSAADSVIHALVFEVTDSMDEISIFF